MANPNPAHNPTDGLDTAVVVNTSGPGVYKLANQLANVPPKIGGHQYALSLAKNATCQLESTLVDVQGNSYSGSGIVYKSYENPNAGTPAWYRPSPVAGYSGDIASVSASGLITGLHGGEATIEVQFPTFDNSEGVDSHTGNPHDMIYSQVIVTVGP